ncbi:hypothetical protein [Photorhabdus luminescens]|uniref:hypothetical protein n=1 Tax=Photorhabdus luminescens TaxID=29488 RepID=UPI001595ECAE|nr:hypothetical protein [Photorhabdus luminescens]
MGISSPYFNSSSFSFRVIVLRFQPSNRAASERALSDSQSDLLTTYFWPLLHYVTAMCKPSRRMMLS